MERQMAEAARGYFNQRECVMFNIRERSSVDTQNWCSVEYVVCAGVMGVSWVGGNGADNL